MGEREKLADAMHKSTLIRHDWCLQLADAILPYIREREKAARREAWMAAGRLADSNGDGVTGDAIRDMIEPESTDAS